MNDYYDPFDCENQCEEYWNDEEYWNEAEFEYYCDEVPELSD